MNVVYGSTGLEMGRSNSFRAERESGGFVEVSKSVDEPEEGIGRYNFTFDKGDGRSLTFSLNDETMLLLEEIIPFIIDFEPEEEA